MFFFLKKPFLVFILGSLCLQNKLHYYHMKYSLKGQIVHNDTQSGISILLFFHEATR